MDDEMDFYTPPAQTPVVYTVAPNGDLIHVPQSAATQSILPATIFGFPSLYVLVAGAAALFLFSGKQ